MRIQATAVKVLAIGLLVFTSCKNENVETETVTIKQVKTETIKNNLKDNKLVFNGLIKEKSLTTLSFRVGGPLVKLNVKPGDYVTKGQVIAEIDKRDYQIQLRSAEAQFKQLEGEYERYKELYAKNKIPANSYEKIESGYLMAKVGYDNAVNQHKDTELKAPFSGYIHDKSTENFQTVGPGQPIVSIIDVSKLEVVLSVSENQINNIKKDPKVLLEVKNAGISNLPVKIESIGEKSKQDGLYEVKLSFSNSPELNINPGMTAEITMLCSNQNQTLDIPSSAIFKDGNNICVWKFNPQTQLVSKQVISVKSFVSDGRILVDKGIEVGDTIITAGVHDLMEGQKVSPIKKPSESNIGGLL